MYTECPENLEKEVILCSVAWGQKGEEACKAGELGSIRKGEEATGKQGGPSADTKPCQRDGRGAGGAVHGRRTQAGSGQ